jgi:hypothetical protein
MGPGLKLLLFLLMLVAATAGVISLFGWGPSPKVEVHTQKPGIGQRTPVVVTVREPARGVAGVRAVLRQDGREEVLAEETLATRQLWMPWADRTPERRLALELGKAKQPWLANGTVRCATPIRWSRRSSCRCG